MEVSVGAGGGGGYGREIIYLSLHCHHQSDLCIRALRAILMFRNCEGHSHKQENVHRPQIMKRKESRSEFEPRSLRLPA